MKFIIGLLIGAGLTYGWFSTYGRLQRTDVVFETRTNVVTRVQYETVIVTQDVYRSVWRTNVVTITNTTSARQAPQTTPANIMYIPDRPRACTPTAVPQPTQPAPTYPAPAVTKPAPSGFRGPRNLPGRDRQGNVTNRNVHIRM